LGGKFPVTGQDSLFTEIFSLLFFIGNFRRSAVALQLLVQKSSPDAPKSRYSLQNSLLAGNLAGDWRDQHCVASQAVRVSENFLL
jgi:hypothetical protein